MIPIKDQALLPGPGFLLPGLGLLLHMLEHLGANLQGEAEEGDEALGVMMVILVAGGEGGQ